MRLLTDQDVYQVTVCQLREWDHDVMTAKELGMQQASDEKRVTPITVESVHRELNLLFCEHTENKLKPLFCVIEPYRYRIRRLWEAR